MSMQRLITTLKMPTMVLVVLVIGAAASVHVSPGINSAENSMGKNPAPGTASHPFRIATDYSSIQAAIDSLEPGIGGTVYIPGPLQARQGHRPDAAELSHADSGGRPKAGQEIANQYLPAPEGRWQRDHPRRKHESGASYRHDRCLLLHPEQPPDPESHRRLWHPPGPATPQAPPRHLALLRLAHVL